MNILNVTTHFFGILFGPIIRVGSKIIKWSPKSSPESSNLLQFPALLTMTFTLTQHNIIFSPDGLGCYELSN